MFSGTTISYHRLQASEDKLMNFIFELHIGNFNKTLYFISAFLLVFFTATVFLDIYYLITFGIAYDDGLKLTAWAFKQFTSILGIITGVCCSFTAYSQSRGSSLRFSNMMTIFSEIYGIYLITEIILNFNEISSSLNSSYNMTIVDTVYFLSCCLLLVGFFLKFFIGKTKQYHTIVTQAILENTKQSINT
jgi:hypothetical protein